MFFRRPDADPRPPDPDAALVRALGGGDETALAALVDRHLARLTALAGRLLDSPAEAQEVAQEVFLRAWARRGTWREGRARYATWLHQVALNLCRDRLRRRREVPATRPGDDPDAGPSPLENRPDPAPGPEAQALRRDEAARVRAALARLPERQREALALTYWQGLDNREAAEALKVSVDALESLLARGRRALRGMLAEERMDQAGGEP